MSYTRRMGNFPKQNPPLSSVGQRRPGPGNNFNSGPQLTNTSYLQPGFQNKPQQQQNQPQQQYQSQVQQQEKPKLPQQQVMQNQLNQPKQVPKTPQQQAVVQKQQQPVGNVSQPPPNIQQNVAQKPPVNVPPKVTGNMQQAAEQMISEQSFMEDTKPVITTTAVEIPGLGNANNAEGENGTTQPKTKPFWMKRNAGRINRAERAKRRNVRLRKLLQPKNALMIINELVGHVSFDLSDAKSTPFEDAKATPFDDLYKASVSVEGMEHVGYGKSKALAKSAAAENAVRSMILNKLKITATPAAVNEDDNKEVNMEVNEENQEDVSWTHIASFAIHKLFSSWGDEGNVCDMISRANSMASLDGSLKEGSVSGLQTQPEQKPAKKLPENAALMNPIMLLNQMHPSAKYEEMGKNGAPPNVQFTIKCTVGNSSFIGSGPNKKAARKQAAFEACKTLLGIQYSPDILEGTSTNKPTPMET